MLEDTTMNDLELDSTAEEIEVPETAKPSKKAKKPATGSKRSIEKPAKKPKAKKEPKAKAKKAKAKKEPSERKRASFDLTGNRVSMKVDDVFTKHLQKIANERELPSVGHAADWVIGVGLTRIAALSRYAAKKA